MSTSTGGASFDPDCGEVQCFDAVVNEDTVEAWKTKDQFQVIGQTELCSVLVAKLTWESVLANRRVIFFIDNEAARLGFVRAYSSVLPSLAIIIDSLLWDFEHGVQSWFARVPTAANVADLPSRMDCSAVVQNYRARVLKPVCPPGSRLDRVCS